MELTGNGFIIIRWALSRLHIMAYTRAIIISITDEHRTKLNIHRVSTTVIVTAHWIDSF